MEKKLKAASDAMLRKALPQAGRASWRDEGFPGLELMGNSQAASWYLRQTIGGKRIRDRLGAWPALTNAKARDAARALLAQRMVAVHATSAEEVIEKREEERARRRISGDIPNLRDVIMDLYWEHHLKKTKSGAQRQREMRRFFDTFLDLRTDRIPHGKFAKYIEAERHRAPAYTSGVVRVAKPMWRWIAKNGWGDDLLADVKPPKSDCRDRDILLPELAKIWIATEAEGGIAGPMLRALMLTGQRLGDVRMMRQGDLALDQGIWTVPKYQTKTGKQYKVFLSDAAKDEILRGIAISGARKADHLVFGHPGNPEKAYTGGSTLRPRMYDRAGLAEDWYFHDFRAALVGRVCDAGISIEVADACLNHAASSTVSGIAARYMRTNMEHRRREAMDLYAQLLLDAVAAEKGENVVSIGGVRA